jgi:DNA-binding MarR family transcriptional regulator
MADNPETTRYRLLTFLRDQERQNLIPDSGEISDALGLSEQDVKDQIDILEHLGAVNATRPLDEKWDAKITGHGKLLLEELQQKLVNQIPREDPARHEFEWDIFISHASEDKESFVRALAVQLSKEWKVWYDEFTLTIGDSLRRSIDHGLTKSRYGVVVLSKNFFLKDWPQWELDGLATREIGGRKVILPIWLDVDAKEVSARSPLLGSRLAAQARDGMDAVIREIRRVVEGPPAEVKNSAKARSPQAQINRTEIELTIGGAKTRPPDMEITVAARHVYGPPVVPLECTIWSRLLLGTNKRQLRAYVEPGVPSEARLSVELRDPARVDVASEADALGWPFQENPDDLWVILRYRDLDDTEHQIARTFSLSVPDNQNEFAIGRATSHMRHRTL